MMLTAAGAGGLSLVQRGPLLVAGWQNLGQASTRWALASRPGESLLVASEVSQIARQPSVADGGSLQ